MKWEVPSVPKNKPLPKEQKVLFALVLHGRNHSQQHGAPTRRFGWQQDTPYPHSALGAQLLPGLLRLSSGPIGVSVEVKTLGSKGTRSFPLLKVLAGLFPELITRERGIAFRLEGKEMQFSPHSLSDALVTQPELWPPIPKLRAVELFHLPSLSALLSHQQPFRQLMAQGSTEATQNQFWQVS